FTTERIPHSESEIGKWFSEAGQINAYETAAAFLAFSGRQIRANELLSVGHPHNKIDSRVIRSLVRGSLLADGLPDIGIGPALSLDDIRRKWEIECQHQIGQFRSAEEQFNTTIQETNGI